MPRKTVKNEYGNDSISSLKGADRVRKRPAVIFGSDGIEGCEHSIFEILSNSIDEAREGFGNKIIVTKYKDNSVEIEDFGRGIPVDYNQSEEKYNWELVFCELYAGGKYENNDSGVYSYALGLNGLGAASTQYSSEFMCVKSYYGGEVSEVNFKKGKPVGELTKTTLSRKEMRTGTVVRWRPDLEVFTDTLIPFEYFDVMLDKQAVSNAKLRFNLKYYDSEKNLTEKSYYYENGIADYISALAGNSSITEPHLVKLETRGRDREDKPEYSLRAEVAFCFSNNVNVLEYYQN
ncbi:MAG: hypothetical protein HUJ63_08000, partial [Enterococcus sp.]|nr:hypothetical protein [Enterococcus sp.]